MKLLLLVTGFFFSVYGNGYSQTISLELKRVSLEQVFSAIEKQSPYHFVYAKEEVAGTVPVTIRIYKASIEEVLQEVMRGQPLLYSINSPYVVIRKKDITVSPADAQAMVQRISGTVLNAEGEPLAGATVAIKGSTYATATNESGAWELSYEGNYSYLRISSVGYQPKEVAISNQKLLSVTLERIINNLDETVVIAYGQTTRKFNTGNVTKVTAATINRQPVNNPLAALAGRVPGLIISQNSGVAGSGFSVQLRGLNSLTQGTEPLFIIDGIPFGNGNKAINQVSSSAVGGLSPFGLLNPSEIESIEILKDADATAIYGSRGANGVVLITTKKGRAGETQVSAQVRSGFSKATRTMPLLTTSEYLQMRREAFANDGIVPTVNNAPDLLVWDTTAYTDFKKMFTGGTAETHDVQLSLSGGSAQTQFYIHGGYYHETGLLSNTQASNKKSLRLNVSHASLDKRFQLQLSNSYSHVRSDLLNRDLAAFINIAPHFPLYDANGNLNWMSGSVPLANLGLANPLAQLQRNYEGRFQQVSSQLHVSYSLFSKVRLRLDGGFQKMYSDEQGAQPKASLDPSSGSLASANFANSQVSTWQLEPQLDYEQAFGKHRISLLAGATFQELINESSSILGYNYNSDLLLSSMNSAGNIIASNDYSQYKYAAGFGRIHYRYKDRYLINLTGRRDGSSRFGPAKRFSNFGAVGIGWIFSAHKWMQQTVPFVSFGKLRFSYGVTGNDQIGDYRFLDTWSSSSTTTYQGSASLQPTRLYNPDYSWEQNNKLETALELGFSKNRVLLTTVYYRNRSDNQLVNFTLPIQTGFASVQQNFGALIENSGWELQLEAKIIQQKHFQWSSSMQVSIPSNKLIRFPGIENTSYRSLFLIGEPITIKRGYRYEGIDAATGVYRFTDADNNGVMDNADRIVRVNVATRYFGGISHHLTYKNWELDVFTEFRKQTGRNYLATQSSFIPGYYYYNQPRLVLDRWQKPGDVPMVQRYVASSNSVAFQPAQSWLANSNAIYGDASFIRVKNVALQYAVPARLLQRMKLESVQLFIQAQNLFTLTNYQGADPENQSIYVLPPLRTIAVGLSVTL